MNIIRILVLKRRVKVDWLDEEYQLNFTVTRVATVNSVAGCLADQKATLLTVLWVPKNLKKKSFCFSHLYFFIKSFT